MILTFIKEVNKLKIKVIYNDDTSEYIEAKETTYDKFIENNKSKMAERNIKGYLFIYPDVPESLIERFKINKLCMNCENFYDQPTISSCGKCRIKGDKLTEDRGTCEQFKLYYWNIIDNITEGQTEYPIAIAKVKISNDLLNGLTWKEIISKYIKS